MEDEAAVVNYVVDEDEEWVALLFGATEKKTFSLYFTTSPLLLNKVKFYVSQIHKWQLRVSVCVCLFLQKGWRGLRTDRRANECMRTIPDTLIYSI